MKTLLIGLALAMGFGVVGCAASTEEGSAEESNTTEPVEEALSSSCATLFADAN